MNSIFVKNIFLRNNKSNVKLWIPLQVEGDLYHHGLVIFVTHLKKELMLF